MKLRFLPSLPLVLSEYSYNCSLLPFPMNYATSNPHVQHRLSASADEDRELGTRGMSYDTFYFPTHADDPFIAEAGS